MAEQKRKRWWIALLEVIVPHSKQLVAAFILWVGLGAGAGYLSSDMLKKPEKVIPVETVPEVTETFCNEDLIVRICGRVMAGHESGPLH